MTKRSATYWRNKIADYESTNPVAEVFTECAYGDDPGYSVTIIIGDGNQYHLWTADDCRMWLDDAY